ncbi:hypothetical protein ACHAWF_002742 [Thalassiosira exigua]
MRPTHAAHCPHLVRFEGTCTSSSLQGQRCTPRFAGIVTQSDVGNGDNVLHFNHEEVSWIDVCAFAITLVGRPSLTTVKAHWHSTDFAVEEMAQTTMDDVSPLKFDAVIVGAGWAGIKAAEVLIGEGVDNILVLEANDYVGGCSKTVNSDGSINVPLPNGVSHEAMDLGSEWFYEDTYIEEGLHDSGLLEAVDYHLSFLDLWDTSFYTQTMNENGGSITADLMDTDDVNDLNYRVWEDFRSFMRELSEAGEDQSYGESLARYIQDEAVDKKDIQYLDLVLATAAIIWAAQPHEISFIESSDWDLKDKDHMIYASVPGAGYGNIAATFADPFSSKIRLGSKVTDIDQTDQNNVIISYTNTDEHTHRVHTKTVLVTTSLGVLKSGDVNFTPPLPQWKQDVIDGMGWGLLNKCIMQWRSKSEIVWPEHEWFGLMTPDAKRSAKWTLFSNPSEKER